MWSWKNSSWRGNKTGNDVFFFLESIWTCPLVSCGYFKGGYKEMGVATLDNWFSCRAATLLDGTRIYGFIRNLLSYKVTTKFVYDTKWMQLDWFVIFLRLIQHTNDDYLTNFPRSLKTLRKKTNLLSILALRIALNKGAPRKIQPQSAHNGQ